MANTRIQMKRTSVSGRLPNTVDPANNQYITTGELAINLTDQVMYSSNGTALITFGAVSPTTYTSTAIYFPVSGQFQVGNSTTVSQMTVNSAGIFVGNSTSNAFVYANSVSVSNSTSNSTLNPQLIFVGNSTTNAQMSMVGGLSTVNLTSFSLAANGIATVNTKFFHGILLTTGYTVTLTGVNDLFNSKPVVITSIPTANSLTFSFNPANDGGAYSRISALSRTNGVATINTVGNHQLTSGWVVGISGTSTIDNGRFETSTSAAKTITVLTANSFSITNQSADVTKTVTTYSVAAIAKASAGAVTLTLTSTTHGFSAGDYVTLSGYSGSLVIGGITYTASMLNARWLISAVATNTFNIILRQKLANETAVAAASGAFSASAKRTYDFPSTQLSVFASVTPVIPTTTLSPATAIATFVDPVNIQVANSSTKVKITPSTIYVGSGTQTVIIDATKGQRFNTPGSILQTSIDGNGFRVASLQSDDGVFDETANTFFANASIVFMGNSSVATSITSGGVQAQTIVSGTNEQNVSINSTSVSINYSGNQQSIISSTYASFPYSVDVGAHLTIGGTIIDSGNNTANASNYVLYGNDSSVYWGPVVNIGSAAPSFLGEGSLWWNSDQGTMKIYYNDGNSSQWVDAARGTPGPTGPMYGSRLVASTDATSITPNANTTDMVTQLNTQAVGTLTINAPTGSPSDGQKLMFRIKSTNIQTLSWNAVYAGGADLTLPSATSGSTLTDYYGFIYNSGLTKWHLLSKISGF